MSTAEIVASSLAVISLLLSGVTFYRTFFARFDGKSWPAMRLVLIHIDTVPSIGLACFFENRGAKPGSLDDLRLRVKHLQTGAIHYFYPHIMRHDYSILKSYNESDWFPFSGIPISENKRMERYILFKPLSDKFYAEEGHYEVVYEIRWYGDKRWVNDSPSLCFSVNAQVVEHWNNPATPALQVNSDAVLERRNSFD